MLSNKAKERLMMATQLVHFSKVFVRKLDGNRFLTVVFPYEDTKFAAETTNVDERIINRFRVILIAMSSGEKIDVQKFRVYATDTAQLYETLYWWYNMPASVHKVLIHGADIINFFHLPIGFYSEEAQEARNKDFRNIREHQTRKSSRENTNEDILHWLLITSDPLISSMRQTAPRKHYEFDKDVLDLFV